LDCRDNIDIYTDNKFNEDSILTICHLASYYIYVKERTNKQHLGTILKRQRMSIPFTLQELAGISEVSASHLGRIERGERFPSAYILRKIAKPLGFEEDELFTLAGYLSSQIPATSESRSPYISEGLDPYVARMLAQEPAEIQRAVIGLLSMLKSIARGIRKEEESERTP
jgi:transcriptional regulator with XRE-family HTH domain